MKKIYSHSNVMSFNCSYCNCRHDKHRKLYKYKRGTGCAPKQIVGNGGTFPDLLEQKNMGVESNKIDSINAENTNTGTESTNTDTEKANTDTFGNTADESTNKGTPTLKEPPSGRTNVQPPEDINL